MDGTGIVVEYYGHKYVVKLWITGVLSDKDRSFDTRQEAMGEAGRLMDGLSLPFNTLTIGGQ